MKMNKEVKMTEIKSFVNDHSFLGPELLVPNLNKTDGSRINMFCSHIHQTVTLKHSEPPKVFSGFENQVGEFSTSFKTAQEDLTIVKIIEKNPLYKLYILVTKDGKYDAIEIKNAENITEHYGYQIINGLESKKESDKVKKGGILYRSNIHDENLNFTYGVNLNAIYLSSEGMTTEDAIRISESASKKLTSYSLEKIEVTLNDNDILCNIYGNNKTYKAFPDIGENVKKQILLSRRRQVYDSMLFDNSNENLKKVNYNTDTVFYVHGKVIDIDIFSNNRKIESLRNSKYYDQILRYHDSNTKYYTEVYKALEPIIKGNSREFYTDGLAYIYKRCRDILDPNIKFKYDKKDFSNFILVFHILSEERAVVGSKVTNRCG